jgi:hypothetical protein
MSPKRLDLPISHNYTVRRESVCFITLLPFPGVSPLPARPYAVASHYAPSRAWEIPLGAALVTAVFTLKTAVAHRKTVAQKIECVTAIGDGELFYGLEFNSSREKNMGDSNQASTIRPAETVGIAADRTRGPRSRQIACSIVTR